MKTTSKMKTTSQIVPSPKLFLPPPQLKRILPDISLWPLTSTAMVELIVDRKCYQLLKLEMEFKMLNMIYKHCACARIQKRQHLKAKEKDQIHQKKCPCRNCIQCLHYPAFAAFLVWASTWLNMWFCPSIPLSVHMFQLASKKYMQRETFPIRPAMATSPFNCFFPRLCVSLCPYLCLLILILFFRKSVRFFQSTTEQCYLRNQN